MDYLTLRFDMLSPPHLSPDQPPAHVTGAAAPRVAGNQAERGC